MYRNILLPVDLSDKHSWRKALPTALALRQTFQATLHVTTVVPDFGLPMVGQYFPSDYEAKMHEHVAAQLADFVAEQCPRTCRSSGSSRPATSTKRFWTRPRRSGPI